MGGSSDFNFKEMPSLTSQHDEVINKDSTYFAGEPAKMLVSTKPEGEEGEAEEAPEENEDDEEKEGKDKPEDSDESEEEEIKAPPRDLTGKFIV